MATLGEMKAAIADEIFRDDLGSTIEREISRAIQFYQRTRFWFNESRTITFNTVNLQEFYDAADHPDIPNLLAIDYMTVTRSGTEITPLCRTTSFDLDTYSVSQANPNVPTDYVYFEQKLRFYPIPNGIYAIRIAGVFRYPAPAVDDEADNHWMTDAEELIRSRAKRNLYLHSLGDQQSAAAMKAAEDEALQSLRAEASTRQNIHTIQPSGIY